MKVVGRINNVPTRLCIKASVGREYPFSIIKEEDWYSHDAEYETADTMVEVYSNVPIVYMNSDEYLEIATTLNDLPSELLSLDIKNAFMVGYIKNEDAKSQKIYIPKNSTEELNKAYDFPLFIATDGKNSIIVHTGGGCTYPIFKGYLSKEKELEIKKYI